MIASVEGNVTQVGTDFIIVKNHGIGLKVSVPKSVINVAEPFKDISLQTYLLVREDALTLFGFETSSDRDFFVLLLGANGVGPKTALSIISILSMDMIRKAVASEQSDIFAHVPGVGKKTAKSILLHLQGKIATSDQDILGTIKEVDSDVMNALTALGYSVIEAQAAMQMIPRDAPSDLETRIKLALQYFS
jgi:Holliday junction DNA helicase RuvA